MLMNIINTYGENMKIYQKIIEGSKTHIYIFGFPVYYENIKDNETKKRFYGCIL